MDLRTIYGAHRLNSKWVSLLRSPRSIVISRFSDDVISTHTHTHSDSLRPLCNFLNKSKIQPLFAPVRIRSTTVAGNIASSWRTPNENDDHDDIVHKQQQQQQQHSKATGDCTPNHMAHPLHQQRRTDQRASGVEQ